MEKQVIKVSVKAKGGERNIANVPLSEESNDVSIEYAMKDMGKLLVSLNPNADIEVNHSVFNSISGTWMVLRSYYVNEGRLVSH